MLFGKNDVREAVLSGKCPSEHVREAVLSRKCPPEHVREAVLSRKCPSEHVREAVLSRKCPSEHVREAVLSGKCPSEQEVDLKYGSPLPTNEDLTGKEFKARAVNEFCCSAFIRSLHPPANSAETRLSEGCMQLRRNIYKGFGTANVELYQYKTQTG